MNTPSNVFPARSSSHGVQPTEAIQFRPASTTVCVYAASCEPS